VDFVWVLIVVIFFAGASRAVNRDIDRLSGRGQ
jgi:hypothetical protein